MVRRPQRRPDPTEHFALGPRSTPTWSAALLTRLLRRPAVYWSAVAALALTSVLVVNRYTADARTLRSAYGATTEVLVTTEPVQPGDLLAERSTRRDVPVGLVPDAVLENVGPDDRAMGPLTTGSILTAAAVSTAAGIGPDDAGVAMPVGPTTPPLAPGQQVLVVINADPLAGTDVHLVDGRVVEVTEERVVVAIARRDLAVTSAALGAGNVVVALRG